MGKSKIIMSLQRKQDLRPVSLKRVRTNKIYSALRKKFLADHPYCQVWLAEHNFTESDVVLGVVTRLDLTGSHWFKVPLATDVHHVKGRRSGNLLRTETWMAVSREYHDRIHREPIWAEERGYLSKQR